MSADLRTQIEADVLELVREWTQMDGRIVLCCGEVDEFRSQIADVISGRES